MKIESSGLSVKLMPTFAAKATGETTDRLLLQSFFMVEL